MKIEQVIEEKYKTLTKSEKKIANYVLESPNHIIYGTMNDIKSEIHVGDATIIRFCQKLGFSGFSDLKIEIAKEDYSQKESQAKDSELFFDEKERKIVYRTIGEEFCITLKCLSNLYFWCWLKRKYGKRFGGNVLTDWYSS